MLPELPSAFVSQMQSQLGEDYPAFVDALNEKPVVSVRLNAIKPGAEFPEGSPIPWCENGLYLPERPVFFRNPLIYTGAFYVQEASSMLVGQCLDFKQDLKVLDLCAAPGGKSTLLLDRLSPDSLLVSNELVGNRSRALIDNLSRWGRPNAFVSNSHPRDLSGLEHFFDAIVVDAPCSGEGMFRKDPKVIDHWSPGVVRNCALRQKDILGQVIGSLKPGGRLVYSTCTYNPQENEQIIQWLLDKEPGVFKVVPMEFPAEWGLTPGTTEGYSEELRHTYHCYPHKVRGEGFFIACLEKTAPSRRIVQSPRALKRQKRNRKPREEAAPRREIQLGKKEIQVAKEFVKGEHPLRVRREGLDAVPQQFMDDLETLEPHLRILKAGIRVGTVLKGKFIPDHDLALSELTPEEVPVVEIEAQTALEYMKRLPVGIEAEGLRGWVILSYQGRHIGWVKVLENRINNHLPKELRLRANI